LLSGVTEKPKFDGTMFQSNKGSRKGALGVRCVPDPHQPALLVDNLMNAIPAVK